MATLKVEFKGFEKVQKDLLRMMDIDNELKKVVRDTGVKAQERTKKYAPVDTGYLKSEVSLKYLNDNRTARIESIAMKNGYNYAYLQEFGGVSRQFRFTPHVRPMFYETRPEFIADMEAIMKKWGR